MLNWLTLGFEAGYESETRAHRNQAIIGAFASP
jgi:hypothetical protein